MVNVSRVIYFVSLLVGKYIMVSTQPNTLQNQAFSVVHTLLLPLVWSLL